MRRPFTPEDLFSIHTISDPQVSPDGASIAFVVSRPHLESNRESSAIYLLPLGGGTPKRLTYSGKKDAAPRWSPGGRRIAFTSNRSGNTQIWVLDLSGGEARQLSRFKAGLGGAMWANNAHAWSPDGNWVACVSRGDVEAPAPTPETDIRVVERIFYKWSGGFNPNQPTHIWIIPAEGGDPRQLTDGDQDDHSLAWSPDGREIAFVSNRTGDGDNNANNDLFAVSLESGQTRRITSTPGPEFTPAWSPDGNWIASAASDRANASKDSPAGNTAIYVIAARGGALRKVSGALDRRSTAPVWSPDGNWIYFSATDRGTRHVYRVAPAGEAVRQVTRGPRQITGFALSPGGLICAAGDEARPAELYHFSPDGDGEARLTGFNDAWCEEIETVPAHTFTCASFDGLDIRGWVLQPAGFQEGHLYPAVLAIHGGPHHTHGHGLRPIHQTLAGAGYGVIYLDPRGSVGYGQAFADGCVDDWGGGDYQDLMDGLDAALQQHPWIDPERLGVTGGSYGGYMTNWVITRTDRFKAGVSHAGLSNNVSFYGTSMYQLLMEYEFGGKPWEVHDAYWSRSPLAHVANARTPLLLTHGEMDHDVPISQSEEFFIALKKRGVPAAFIRYPREGHGISEPAHTRDFLDRHLNWFNRYLKPEDL